MNDDNSDDDVNDEDDDGKRSNGTAAPLSPVPVPVLKPPIALLVAAVGENIFFDPSGEELAVADAVVAVTVAGLGGEMVRRRRRRKGKGGIEGKDDRKGGREEKEEEEEKGLKVVAVRMVDPPARLSSATTATTTEVGEGAMAAAEEAGEDEGVWRPRRGGVSRTLLKRMVGMCVESGGVGEEVLHGLSGFL